MGNIVKLVFQAVATGSGLSKMYGEVKGLAKAMPGLTQAATILGGAFGSVGASFGRMATMMLQGGIWGAAAEGARLLIDRLGLLKDRSEEAKKRLEELKAASERYHEAILNGTEKALAKIDAETKRRNAQLDITNRMIKAELELQRARAVASGDVGKAESIGREIERRGNEATMEKAVANSNAAGTRSREADAGLEVARKAWQEAQRELTKAKKALAAASVPIRTTQIMQSSVGAFAMTNTVHRDTTNEQAAVKAARERLALAEKTLETARKTAAEERIRYQQAKDEVKALAKEQFAAEEKAHAEKMAKQNKAIEESRKAAKKAAEDQAYEEANKIRELRKKEAEEEKKRLIERTNAELKAAQKAKEDKLRADIEADRVRVAELERRLAEARAAVPATIDVLGNAARMDQAGELRNERQKDITDERFNARFTKLLTSGKIKRDANGNWKIDGRASNLDKAVLDRLNAQEKVKRAEAEAAKERQRLEKMEGYLKTISETIKTATEI